MLEGGGEGVKGKVVKPTKHQGDAVFVCDLCWPGEEVLHISQGGNVFRTNCLSEERVERVGLLFSFLKYRFGF